MSDSLHDPNGSNLPQRELRAISLIALAVVLIATAGVIYLHSTTPSAPNSTALNPVDRNLVSASSVDYDFTTPTLGWALVDLGNEPPSTVGRFWIFGSTDGAKHWHQEVTGLSTSTLLTPHSIQFLDASHGFALVGGTPGQLYRTDDGGTDWASLRLPATDVAEVAFIDAMNGLLLASGQPLTTQITPLVIPFHLYATSDAGVNWHALPDTPPSASVGAFRNPTEAWMGGAGFGRPFVYLSSDAARTWHPRYLPSPPGQTWDASAAGGVILLPSNVNLLPGSGVVADVTNSSEHYLFSSFDTGQTWKYVPAPPGLPAYEDALHWWAVGGNTLFKSSDAGQSWVAVSHAVPRSLEGLRVLDSQHAWGVTIEAGGYGLVVTSDGGQRWTKADVPRPEQPLPPL
jgi:photosystem II stability/assembly factor-like uncharacterized protein